MKYRFMAVILLVIILWLEVSTLSITAATPDEPMHINLPIDLRSYTVAIGLYNPETNTRLSFNLNEQPQDHLILASSDSP